MSWVSPVVGGVTGLASGLISYFGQQSANEAMLDATQQTNDLNYKIWQEQQEHNVDMFNMQNQANIDNWWTQFNATNAYNSASAQRQRLEEAGLNPYLMMNGGSAGTASSSSIPSASATPAQAPTMQTAPPQAFTPAGVVAAQQSISGLLGLVQSLNIGVDSDLKTAQANEIDESLPFKLSSLSAHADMDNMTSKFMKEFGYDTAKYNLENLKFETSLNKSRFDYQELENQLKKDTMQDVVANVHAQRLLSDLNVEQAKIINKHLDANQQLQLAKLAEECALFKSQTSLNEKQADYIVAQKFKVWAETQGIKLDNKFKTDTMDYRVKQEQNKQYITEYEGDLLHYNAELANKQGTGQDIKNLTDYKQYEYLEQTFDSMVKSANSRNNYESLLNKNNTIIEDNINDNSQNWLFRNIGGLATFIKRNSPIGLSFKF